MHKLPDERTEKQKHDDAKEAAKGRPWVAAWVIACRCVNCNALRVAWIAKANDE